METNDFNGDTSNKVFLKRDSSHLVSGDESNLIFWDLGSGGITKIVENHHSENIFCVEYEKKGHFLLTSSMDNTIKLLSLKNGKVSRTIKTGDENSVGTNVSLEIVKRNRFATCCYGKENAIRIYNQKGKLYRKLVGHNKTVNKLKYLDGHFLLSASDDCSICLWDYKKNVIVKRFKGHKDGVLGMDISHDKRYFITASEDESIKIWDLKSRKCVKTLYGHCASVTSLSFLPNYNIVSCDSSGQIRHWDWKTKKTILKWKAHKKYIWNLLLLEDQIVSCSSDRTVKFWNILEGLCRRTFECNNEVYSLALVKKA